MSENDILRPLKIFGIILGVVGLFGIILDLIYLGDRDVSAGFKLLGLLISLWHLLAGIGILLRQVWGFYLFKSYLYILCLGIPLGTYISVKFLNYIKTNKVKELFR